ncbi:MAG: flagellar M-ring protein FliF [Acidobacteria bacterium]|nr:flagellar M-ring protein FliF [Acidobacteriota bacterium]
MLENLKRLQSSLSAAQMATLAGALVAVIGIVLGSAYYLNRPDYTLLYSDLDAESASAVVERLKAANVPYELVDGGRAVRVASNRADEMRLDIASQGLPTSGRIGFEVFDRTQFGTTEFLEQVNYRRALEGELARTISTISEVSSARVHIALAKKSLFAGQSEQAKASVVLKLRSNKPLAESTIRGIAGLVSGSVEALRVENVVIVDTLGRPLLKNDQTAEASSGALREREHVLARELELQVVSLLEPVVGAGRVRVNVAAQLKAGTQEETEEQWDPETVVRSRQTSTDTTAAMAMQGGLAGARANLPANASTGQPAPAQATAVNNTGAPGTPATANGQQATAAAPPPGRMSETTNYEIGKRVVHRIEPSGQLARLSVAVILDNQAVTATNEQGETQTTAKPREADEVDRIRRLVSAAVGLDTERGDQLTVENIAFDTPTETVEPPPDTWTKVTRWTESNGANVINPIVVLILGLLAFFMVLRPMIRGVFGAPKSKMDVSGVQVAGAALAEGVRTVSDMQNEIEAQIDADLASKSASGNRRLPALARRIARQADNEPEQVAQVMRAWIAEGER